MNEIEERIKSSHAAVYLTLVSVVVALALEDLLSHVRGSAVLWQVTLSAWQLWAKVFLAFSGAFVVWVAYCAVILTFRWVLGIWDAAQVFLIAVVLLLLDSLAFLERGELLLYAAAVYTLSGNAVLYGNLRRARHDAENREILGRMSYRNTIAFGVGLGCLALVFALLLHVRVAGAIAELCFDMAVTLGFLTWLALFMRGWRRAVSLPGGSCA